MQPFRFSLQKLLNWSERQAEIELDRAARCYAALEQVRQAITQMETERRAAEQSVLDGATISAASLAALERYRLGARKRSAALQQSRAEAERKLAQQQERLKIARRKLRSIEILRSRKIDEYRYAADRELEELAADGYIAKWNEQARLHRSRDASNTVGEPGSR